MFWFSTWCNLDVYLGVESAVNKNSLHIPIKNTNFAVVL